MFQIAKNFSSGTRNVVKNISSEVVRECAKQGITISADVASLGLILMSLDPDHGISLTSQNDRSTLENFVGFCVSKFLDDQSPLVKTLQMQEYFLSNSIDPERVLKKYQLSIDEKAQPLYKEIVEIENPNKEEQEKLFKKIMVYINMTYLLGSPTNVDVLTETSYALKSVMSRADLTDFFVLKKKARAQQLKAIQEVVCGIRVFNKDAGHCGEGIRDIQSDLQYAFENTQTALAEKLDKVASRIKKLTQHLYSLCNIDIEEDTIRYNLPEDFTEDQFHYLKGMLILSLQHELYIKSLTTSLNQVKVDIDQHLEDFRKVLNIIHDIVQYRTAVPTEKVFPHFTQVAVLWQSMLSCIYLLIEINKTNEHMYIIVDMRICDRLLRRKIYTKLPIETDLSLQALTNEMKKSGLPYIAPNNQAAMNSTPISKFCPYVFFTCDGLLFPGKTNAGYVQYEDVLFSFNSTEYGRKFLSNVVENFDKFILVLRKHPQVVVFFDVYEFVSSHQTTRVQKVEEVKVVRLDCEVQTEVHPVPYNKNRDYTWNIWDLRRKAIQLANLKKCRTHSAQTDVSYHRLNVNLQTADPKEMDCQTMCNAYTNFTKKDAATECSEEDGRTDLRAVASSGVRCTKPLKDYYILPYRFMPKKS